MRLLKIKVKAIVEPDYESSFGLYWKDVLDEIFEGLPSSNNSSNYDEKTLEDWYNFAGTIEGYIDNFCDTVKISISKNANSLSEYIDFYVYDEFGNKKNCLIDLRLSDHASTSNARELRKKKAAKLDVNYKLISVVINDRTFTSYDEAENYIRRLIAEKCFK